MTGGEVEKYYREGRIQEIAEYCETHVVNTYRVWLRYELFRRLPTDTEYGASETFPSDFLKVRGNTKPHLAELGNTPGAYRAGRPRLRVSFPGPRFCI